MKSPPEFNELLSAMILNPFFESKPIQEYFLCLAICIQVKMNNACIFYENIADSGATPAYT